MTRYCEICGRRLRTGIKYCSECKNNPSGRKNKPWFDVKEKRIIFKAIFIWVLFGLLLLWIYNYLNSGGSVFWLYFFGVIMTGVIIWYLVTKKLRI